MANGSSLPLVLASGSPRRLELLRSMGIPFEVDAPVVDESCQGPPESQVLELAVRKAEAAAMRHPGRVIVAADTLVHVEDAVLGKPKTPAEAKAMLQSLSGRWHGVYTGICVLDGAKGARLAKAQRTEVLFAKLTDDIVDKYIHTGEPMDKAGAYAIQGIGGMFVEEIRGSFSNVIGLPTALLRELLEAVGIDVLI